MSIRPLRKGLLVRALAGAAVMLPVVAAAPLRDFTTDHYQMHTDVSPDLAKEARIRLDRMFDEYAFRTSAFSKPPTGKFPFYLFTKSEDYQAAGGLKGSAGVFIVRGDDARLMGTVIPNGGTWHVIQHEGFHQFAYFAIAKNLPLWVNEGLAEYFGEARFTGDGMVSGLVPEGRRRRVVEMIKKGTHHSFGEILTISNQQWAKEMAIANYDQAWSMVHFMAEGEGGKYQKALLNYMTALGKGIPEEKAWTAAVGQNATKDFEAAWKRYWLAMPVNPTEQLYAQARMMTLASFLARSRAAGQNWATARDFVAAAKAGKIRIDGDPAIWLPDSLLEEAVEEAGDDASMKLDWLPGGFPRLARQYPDGTTVVVTYSMQGKRPRTVAETRRAGSGR